MRAVGEENQRPTCLELFVSVDPEPPVSLYAYAPVFRVRDRRGDWVVKRTGLARSSGPAIGRWCAGLRAAGVDVVAPAPEFAPNPRPDADGIWWAVYPFVEGRSYAGGEHEIAAAGRLLGAIHAADADSATALDCFPEPVMRSRDWVASHAERAVDAMRVAGLDAAKFVRLVDERSRAVTAISGLPVVGCSADFKAANLVYAPHPVLVDPDHAALMPRLYDLAVAALLFHNDLPSAPHRLWIRREWLIFLAAYQARSPLTGLERRHWSMVLASAWLDQGVWLLGNFPEGWAEPAEAAYLRDVATSDLHQFRLGSEED